MLKCRDIGDLLLDYVEGALEPSVQRALDAHLADCPGCVAFINTYKHTIGLSRNLRCDEIPPELKKKLRSFITEKLGKPRL